MLTSAAEALPAGVPAQLTHFVGRTRELAEIQRVLSSTRLLTLTGVGGSGKTRLAIETASAAHLRYTDGVTWVELSPLTTQALVPQHVASALGMREPPAQSATELLTQHLRERELLLVLDNCEHLVDACASLVDALLRGCPRLTVLATSREALGVSGERAWLVPPLSLPPGPVGSAELAADAEAVQLFVDRAQSVAPSFDLSDRNVRAVVRICRRLDGIPLAIELAAARVKVLAPEQIADRLEDSFKLLASGSRTAVPRHRTLREAIDWSYLLLSGQEQLLLRRLAVFAGGFTLEAAEAICAGGEIDPLDVLDLLTALVDKSLLAVQPTANSTRYRMLMTVRQYAQDHLEQSGQAETLQARHARYFLDMAEDAAPYLWGGASDPVLVARLTEEADNLRALAEWCRGGGSERLTMELRLGVAVHWLLFARGWFREGRERLTRALAEPVVVDALDRARAQTALAGIALWQGDTKAVPPIAAECIPILRDHGDRTYYAYANAILGAALSLDGDAYRAEPILAEAVDVAGTQPNRVLYAIAHYWQATAARARGEFDLAYQSYDVGVRIGREMNNNPSTAHPLNALGRLLLQRGQLGDATVALTMLTEALELHRSIDDRWGMAWCLEGLAAAALALSQPERAVTLLSAAQRLRETLSAPLPPAERVERDKILASARTTLGGSAFSAAWETGAHYSLTAALAYALQEDQPEPSSEVASPPRAAAAGSKKSEPESDLRILALGPLRIYRGDTLLDGDAWRSSKARELLLFLLCHPDGVTREQIGVALWTEATSAQLRNNFHVTVHRLRKGLGESSWIEVANDRYRIAPHVRLDFDVERFKQEVTASLREQRRGNDVRDRLRAALSLYRGDLLDGEKVGDWHMELRDHLQRLLRDGLSALGAAGLEQERYPEAAAAFEHLIAIDAFNEDAYRQLLHIYAARGDRGAAVRLYQKLVRLLDTELDAEPEPQTTALYQRVAG